MTPEEASQLYNIEQRNYYDYCGYIQSYQNKIDAYRSERQNKNILAEGKRDEIRKNQEYLILSAIRRQAATDFFLV